MSAIRAKHAKIWIKGASIGIANSIKFILSKVLYGVQHEIILFSTSIFLFKNIVSLPYTDPNQPYSNLVSQYQFYFNKY